MESIHYIDDVSYRIHVLARVLRAATAVLVWVCGAHGCLDLSSSAGVWLHTIISALRKEPCSGSLFCVCGNLGPFGNFSVSS